MMLGLVRNVRTHNIPMRRALTLKAPYPSCHAN
jgi:hypothetical protein